MGSEREEKEDEEDRGEDTGSQEDEAAEQQRQGAPELDPRGLFSARGSLSAPVKGKVVQHFGKVKLASFKDVLFSKGVEFSTPENDEVHAVLAGLVAFSGTLPGYDTVVILDHGARSYSLYGRLGTSVVKKGETVCIIEAMKILNEIEADKSGTVTRILVDNGQAVEYGQPLFMIE